MANTHYAVLVFGGDLDGDHPDPELRARSPHLKLIACGSEEHCWDALAHWTAEHPLRLWEEAEVLERHPSVCFSVETPPYRGAGYRPGEGI